MTTGPSSGSGAGDGAPTHAGLVYVTPDRHSPGYVESDVSLGELWAMIWQGKWLIIGITSLFALLAVTYALVATEWYRADTLLSPVEEVSSPGIAGQFAGLASLAGIEVGGGPNGESLAVLSSREFARDFIQDQNLMVVFFADRWDAQAQKWSDVDPDDWPDIRDAVKLFHEDVLTVADNEGLVSLSIEWTDPDVAAEWASLLVDRLNDRMRRRALKEAESNVAYLQSELVNTDLATIRQSIGQLLEIEFQKLMMARGRQEFSYRVIDSAVPPKERSRPRRALIAILGTFLGGIVGTFVALILGIRRQQRIRGEAAAEA